MFNTSLDIRALVSTLVVEVPRLAGDPNSNPKWTVAVADVLHKLGAKENCTVYSHATDQNRNCKEWLCDVVWYRRHPNLGMILAAESEWGNAGSVLDDFERLLAVKAPFKVLLFAFKPQSNQSNKAWTGIREYLGKYPYLLAGETFAFIEYQLTGNRAELLQIERDGQQDGFHFQTIDLSEQQKAAQ